MDGRSSSKPARRRNGGTTFSASLLHHAGFSQWIAESIEEYVDIAQNLALQGNRSRDERMRLRNKLKTLRLRWQTIKR